MADAQSWGVSELVKYIMKKILARLDEKSQFLRQQSFGLLILFRGFNQTFIAHNPKLGVRVRSYI